MVSVAILKSSAQQACSAGSNSSTLSNSSIRSPWHLSNIPCICPSISPNHHHMPKCPRTPPIARLTNRCYSILFQYRIFPIVQFRRILLWCNHFVVCLTISCVFVSVFQCIPIHAFWDTLAGTLTPELGGRCINVELYFLIVGSINAATDFVLLALVSGEYERCIT